MKTETKLVYLIAILCTLIAVLTVGILYTEKEYKNERLKTKYEYLQKETDYITNLSLLRNTLMKVSETDCLSPTMYELINATMVATDPPFSKEDSVIVSKARKELNNITKQLLLTY